MLALQRTRTSYPGTMSRIYSIFLTNPKYTESFAGTRTTSETSIYLNFTTSDNAALRCLIDSAALFIFVHFLPTFAIHQKDVCGSERHLCILFCPTWGVIKRPLRRSCRSGENDGRASSFADRPRLAATRVCAEASFVKRQTPVMNGEPASGIRKASFWFVVWQKGIDCTFQYYTLRRRAAFSRSQQGRVRFDKKTFAEKAFQA